MPGLTVAEKEHWKERIGKRIEHRIEALAAEDPNLMERVERVARKAALESLQLGDLQAELDAIEEQEKQLGARSKAIQRQMLATVRGTPVDESTIYYSRQNSEVEKAVGRRQAVYEERFLAESELGQRIVWLRQERENLLDTVWLATSGNEVRALWSKEAELLGEQPTQLQQEALSIDAPAEG